MGASLWLVADTGGEHLAGLDEVSISITYNLSPMLKAAGFPGWDKIVGQQAQDVRDVFEATIQKLLTDPKRFQEMSDPDGWGTYDQAVRKLTALADACTAHPLAYWEGSL